MRLVLILSGIVAAVVVLFAVYVRLAPSDPATWHVDPRDVSADSTMGRYLLVDGAADGDAPRFAGAPVDVMGAFNGIALASPRVNVLAGSVEEGHVTYVARSRVFGFPDYISVMAYPDGDQTALAIYGRLRFGQSDLGVNEKRVQAWLSQMRAPTP